jgi:hypothetical protein
MSPRPDGLGSEPLTTSPRTEPTLHPSCSRVKSSQTRFAVRIAAENVEAMLDAGAEGAVLQFPDEAAMRDFAGRRHQ